MESKRKIDSEYTSRLENCHHIHIIENERTRLGTLSTTNFIARAVRSDLSWTASTSTPNRYSPRFDRTSVGSARRKSIRISIICNDCSHSDRYQGRTGSESPAGALERISLNNSHLVDGCQNGGNDAGPVTVISLNFSILKRISRFKLRGRLIGSERQQFRVNFKLVVERTPIMEKTP